MPDFYIDVDTAVTIPVNILALIDDTDFITREMGIVYNQAGMDLVWNFVTSAGVITQTAVTPTTAGVYDWTHSGDAMYKIEIPASGGGSINNDAEGYGWFSGICTGVLAWRGPTVGFRAAALNDALMDGGDILDVNLAEMGGVAQSATDLKDFADEGYDPATNKVQGVVLVDTTTTNTDMRGTDSAATAAALATVDSNVDAILVDTGTTLPAQISGLNNLSAAQVNSEMADVITTDTISEQTQGQPPTNPNLAQAISYLYGSLIFGGLANATSKKFYNSSGTVMYKKTLSDDGTDYTEARSVTGP